VSQCTVCGGGAGGTHREVLWLVGHTHVTGDKFLVCSKMRLELQITPVHTALPYSLAASRGKDPGQGRATKERE